MATGTEFVKAQVIDQDHDQVGTQCHGSSITVALDKWRQCKRSATRGSSSSTSKQPCSPSGCTPGHRAGAAPGVVKPGLGECVGGEDDPATALRRGRNAVAQERLLCFYALSSWGLRKRARVGPREILLSLYSLHF